MKPIALPKEFPKNSEEWARVIAAAPDRVDDPECPYDPNDPAAVDAFWKNAVTVPEGGLPALREALTKRRRARGPQKTPTKVPTTIRFDPDVLDALRASGKGWQTRVNEVVKAWLKDQTPA